MANQYVVEPQDIHDRKDRVARKSLDAGLPAKVGDGIGDLKRFVLFPSGVGIGVQHLTCLHFLCDPVNANDVSCGRFPRP